MRALDCVLWIARHMTLIDSHACCRPFRSSTALALQGQSLSGAETHSVLAVSETGALCMLEVRVDRQSIMMAM